LDAHVSAARAGDETIREIEYSWQARSTCGQFIGKLTGLTKVLVGDLDGVQVLP
jgi:hypothetical protein